MGAWGISALAPNQNLNNTNFPAVWEDSGKIYCKGQGEYDINVYDIATEVWSLFHNISANMAYPQTRTISTELLWSNNGYIYVSSVGLDDGINGFWRIVKINISSKSETTTELNSGIYSTFLGAYHHKTVVKTLSGRIFIINWSLKQIWEFLPNETFVQINVTWPTSSNWITCLSGQSGPTACTYGDDIYLCGGISVNDSNAHIYKLVVDSRVFTTCGTLNIQCGATGGWTYYPPMDGMFFPLGNKIYWYGGGYSAQNNIGNDGVGSGGTLPVTKVMSLDVNTNIWSQVSDLAVTPYKFHSAVVSGSAAYLIGGNLSGSASVAVNKFTYILGSPVQITPAYLSSTSAYISWTDTSGDNPDGYIIERLIDGTTSWVQVGISPKTTLHYTDNTIDLLTHGYWYRIKSYVLSV